MASAEDVFWDCAAQLFGLDGVEWVGIADIDEASWLALLIESVDFVCPGKR